MGLRLSLAGGLSLGRAAASLPFARPSISGTAAVGEVLTLADFGTYDSVQWTRDGTNIATETGGTYTVVEADEGTTIRCACTIGTDTVASNGIAIPAATFTFDTTAATFDSTANTFDEAA